jgi:translocation and assembly module TamB
MSLHSNQDPKHAKESPEEKLKREAALIRARIAERPWLVRLLRALAWTGIGLVALLLVAFLAFWYYSTTADFQHRVGGKVVAILEESTGGKVDLGHLSFDLRHLAIEVDGLVIHGTEAAGEAPYVSIAKLLVRVKINTFLAQGAASGPRSHVGLSYLRAEQPHFHLIIDKDGRTNQPVPKHPSTSTEPLQDTLLDLQASRVELADGLAVVNDRAIPFDLAANQLNVDVNYIHSTDRYGTSISLDDLQTKLDKQPDVHSQLHLTAEIGRDMFALKSFEFDSGAKSKLTASALVDHFAKPEWQAALNGELDLKQVGYLADVPGFDAGSVQLQVNGRNCEVTPQVAQKHPHFWQRRNPKHAPAQEKLLAPSPECKSGYLLVGHVKASGVSYANPDVRLRNVNAAANLQVTPTELLFTALTGRLTEGGTIDGQLKIENWLGEVDTSQTPASATAVAAAKTANTVAKDAHAGPIVKTVTEAPPIERAHAYLTVKLSRITLRTILAATAPRGEGDLGLDTQVSGPVNVEWGGPATDIASSVLVDANLQLSPTGVTPPHVRQSVPVSGVVIARYQGSDETVRIQRVDVETPATSLNVNGTLGVNDGDPLTSLNVKLTANDLGEFDSTLQTLGLVENGKKGSAALPVVLHGTLNFTGTARGAVRDLDVKGHLEANALEVKLGTSVDVLIDSVVADAEYSPSHGVAVAASTIKRKTAVLNVSGAFRPRRVVSRHGGVSFVWDEGTYIDAKVGLTNAQAADLLQIAGQQQNVPLTGLANIQGHAVGTLKDLTGGAMVSLTNGVAYGEPYQSIGVNGTFQGTQVLVSSAVVTAHGMTVTGNGAYDMASGHLKAHVQGNDLVLSKIDTLHKAQPDIDGVLSLNADADGTASMPNLHATLSLAKLSYEGKMLGQLQATANSVGSVVNYQVTSNLIGTSLGVEGHTALTGDYDTQARVTLSGLDIARPLAMFSPDGLKGTSNISGVITVSGPAAKPTQLVGTATFSPVDVTLSGIALRSPEPLQASLRNGVLAIEQLHITGPDTDLQVGGTAHVFGDTSGQGGELALHATGGVNMALLHTFDKDYISSGKVTFKIAAEGRLKAPQLAGSVNFVGVNLAVDGIPNGLSNMNGTLVFAQNRLDVQNLTATTGGGQLKIGGSLFYQQRGLYADLTATGDNVRVRLYGLSSTANANFHLQGSLQGAVLSGSVLITRFGIGPDVDFAAFAGSGGVSLPPDPNAAANKIRLDVHVTSEPQLDFQNSYAKLSGNVDLSVRGTLAVPSILGKIQITDGSATFAGTKYQLQRGTIYFTNPVRIDPVVDLDATARVENYDITISLHGTAASLKTTYRSEPPLTEADIFNLLALGRTQEEAQLYQEQQVQAGTDPTTSALLGGALNATVSSRVGKLFGAGSVKIDPAFVGTLGNSSARITVEEPITKQLTLTFATNVNESAEQLIQLQYQIDENRSLVLTRDESGVFSVVFKIRRRYR